MSINVASPGASAQPLAVALKNLVPSVAGQRTIVGLGDSNMARALNVSGNSVINSGAGILTWIGILSRQRFYSPPSMNFGVNGNSSSQILARVGDVVAARPDICAVLMGTNDAPVSMANTTANMSATYDLLEAAGIITLAFTIPGSGAGARAQLTTSQIRNVQRTNEWLRRQAFVRRNFILIDLGVAFDDPTSSTHAARAGANDLR